MTEALTLAVLGAGSWGTALSALTAQSGIPTRLWARDHQAIAAMVATGFNDRYLPDIVLPSSLIYHSELVAAVKGVDLVLIAVPSHAFASLLDQIAPLLNAHTAITWASKGFEPGTGRFLHELVKEKLPNRPLAVITGPSFAREVAQGLPSAVTVHSEDEAFAKQLTAVLHTPNFRAYSGTDVLGAELGGAMKNVLAVASGVADGMGLGLNARAALMTRGMNEMLRLGVALGAQSKTLMGLAGFGDLVLTCTGDLSRNRRFGMALGQGMAIAEALREIGQVVESVTTVNEIMRLAAKCDLDLPITTSVHAVLHGHSTPGDALRNLLARERKPEYPDCYCEC